MSSEKVIDINSKKRTGADAILDSQPETSLDADIIELNKTYAMLLLGSKTVILRTPPPGQLYIGGERKGTPPQPYKVLQVGAFKDWLGNRFITRGEDNKRKSLADFWMRHSDRRQFEDLVFAPNREVEGCYNLWRGFAVQPKKGDCSKFLAHLKDNVCAGNEDLYRWVVGWFAAIVQKPEEKCGTSLVLRGKMGVGKTKVGDVFERLLGVHYVKVTDQENITGKNNAHLVACLLLHADEAFWAGDKSGLGRLLDLVTGKWHWIEDKFVPKYPVANYVRLLIMGNADWVVPAGMEERRFAVLDVGEGQIGKGKYFAAIDEQMENGGYEALLHHLQNFDLSTVDLRNIPKTNALLEQKISSMNAERAWWLDTLMRGELPWGCQEPNVCLTDTMFSRYIAHAGRTGVKHRKISTQIGMFLRKVAPGVIKQEGEYQFFSVNKGVPDAAYGYLYRFPTLDECRKAFEKEMQQEIAWPVPVNGKVAEWRKERKEWSEDASSPSKPGEPL